MIYSSMRKYWSVNRISNKDLSLYRYQKIIRSLFFVSNIDINALISILFACRTVRVSLYLIPKKIIVA